MYYVPQQRFSNPIQTEQLLSGPCFLTEGIKKVLKYSDFLVQQTRLVFITEQVKYWRQYQCIKFVCTKIVILISTHPVKSDIALVCNLKKVLEL